MRKIFGRRGVPPGDETLDLTILDDVVAGDPDAAELYDDWADRLQERRRAKLDPLENAPDEEAPNHWAADGVFGGEEPIGEHSTAELMNILDLTADADLDQVTASYRQKALEHHPDRFAGSDDDERRAHEAEMARINDVYHELRARLAP